MILSAVTLELQMKTQLFSTCSKKKMLSLTKIGTEIDCQQQFVVDSELNEINGGKGGFSGDSLSKVIQSRHTSVMLPNATLLRLLLFSE